MRILLDTCVLYSRFLRKVLLEIASNNIFVPFWSENILDEWKSVTKIKNENLISQINIEILLLNASWPNSCISINKEDEIKVFLPDLNDRHVLLAAIKSKSSILLTENLKDFPVGTMNRYNISPRSPESFFLQLYSENPELMKKAIIKIFNQEKETLGKDLNLKKILKNNNLKRLYKLII